MDDEDLISFDGAFEAVRNPDSYPNEVGQLGNDEEIVQKDSLPPIMQLDLNSQSDPDSNAIGTTSDSRDGDDTHGADGEAEEDEEDFNRFVIRPERPRDISEKKRLDTAAFAAWIQENQNQINSSKESSQNVERPREGRLHKRIITKPREYQNDLFERAKHKNIIVVLDTGSGKTLIGVLLVRYIVEQELENRALGKPKKIAFFLVDKGPLCAQQFKVLEENLEYPMAKFHGTIAGSGKNKEFWDEQFNTKMVIVCTAQILLDCLNSGYIRINQINLLIFDEAHHTKKNHPYARIIKHHYLRERVTEDRPRILGMTASPVDAQTRDVRATASELESLLCSEIATVSDEVLEENFISRSQIETVETYPQLINPLDANTKLWDEIFKHTSGNPQFRPGLDFARDAASELGPWCADRYWKLQITESEVPKLQARTAHGMGAQFSPAEISMAVDAVQEVERIVKEYSLPAASREPPQISSKVALLWDILSDAFSQGTSRCIVFVEKRSTAFLLADLFTQTELRIHGLIPSFMVGSQTGLFNFGNMSIRDQTNALYKFRKGETNCLFATPIAEEGIDIPACDLIIRFDLYNSVIQYIQSKGRARQSKSRYISMVEEGNMIHKKRLLQASRDSLALRKFCCALPADRKVDEGEQIDAVAAANYELLGQKAFEVPSTGARLTFANSLEVLAKFVTSLPNPGNEYLSADYVITSFGKKFAADVILPDASPIKLISGFTQQSKLLARCSAAFEACVELINKKYIDEHFQPVYVKKVHAMRNARLAISPHKQSEYFMRLRPEIWSQLSSKTPQQLFETVVAFCNSKFLEDPSKPIVLLTRAPLPSIPDIPLFFGVGGAKIARLISSNTEKVFTLDKVEALAGYTLRVFADVFSKDYEATAIELPYFLAPSSTSHTDVIDGSPAILDWDAIKRTQQCQYLGWEETDEEFFHKKFVIDPLDGSRKFFMHGINKELKPSDPTPHGVPEPKGRPYRDSDRSIKEYSNSMWTKARQRAVWKDDQPVVNAELLGLRRNLLDELAADEGVEESRTCYLILEPLRISTLSVEIVSMAIVMPAILHRVDSVLIALDACALLGLDIAPNLALEAMTKDSDNTEEHGEEQMNFQGGMGNNYERLEFLGDCFLKMATTISLFTLIPDFDESQYHDERMLMICNQNLFNHAVDRKLYEYIRSKSFDRRTWYPNLKLRKGKAPKLEVHHKLADKSIADVCEALIGAAYLGGIERGDMDMAVTAVTRMVNNKKHEMLTFKEYYENFKVPEWHLEATTAAQRNAVDQIAQVTGYRFESPPLLRSAFKHPSYSYESIPHYQRLEFLGDALLDMAIVDHLFNNFPKADPQWLTEHKMAIASNQFLGCLCVKLGLHKHLLRSTSALNGQISQYITDLEHVESTSQNEETTGNAPRKDSWVNAPQPPKALSDMVEALVGAMFVDSKYNYTVVQTFFEKFILPYFVDMELYDTFAQKHPVTYLARVLGEMGCTRWRLCATNIPCPAEEGLAAVTESDVVCALMVHEKVIFHEVAKSGRYGKIRVAKKALAKIGEWSNEDYKRETGCSCQGGVSDEKLEDHGTAI